MALSALPNAFDLDEISKGYFPHLFSTPKNQQYVGQYQSQNFMTQTV